MAKLQCIATCYMPRTDGVLERYEDEYGDERDIYEVPEARVKEFLDTGKFKRVGK